MTADSSSLRPVLVALSDPDPIYREKLGLWFRTEPDLKLLDDSLSDPQPADVLLLSTSADSSETIAILDRVQNAGGSTRVVLLTISEDQEFFVRAVRSGCRGFLHKESNPDLLLKCIRKVNEGELWVDRATTAQVLRQFTDGHVPHRPKERDPKNSPLSPREREIVILVVQGYKNKELAGKLTISEQTVKNHMHNIFDKLGVSDRLELALYAIHNNLHKA